MTEMTRKRKLLSGVQKLTARFLCHEQPSKEQLPSSSPSTKRPCEFNETYNQWPNPVHRQPIDSWRTDPVYEQGADVTYNYDDVDKTVEPVYSSVLPVDVIKGCSRWSGAGLGDSSQRDTVSHNNNSTSARVGASRRGLEKDKGQSSESKVSCALSELTRCRYMHHRHHRHHRRRSVKVSELKEVNIDAKNLNSVDSGFTDDLLLSTTFCQQETISEGRFIFNFILISRFQLCG